ncbi:MAG TPA: NAD(P)H-dependent oxidoreductase [Patescibacteria group bacterium]|nr:NAD(P)H-dependent oxidoreductase [Patescibacteria group bacterium]
MDEPLHIVIIAGTSREARRSIAAAKWVAAQLSKRDGVEVSFADPAEMHIPHDGDDEQDPRFTATTAKADGFYVVTPEYNHSIPGSLKRLLDSEFDNYWHKPVGTAGVSSGQWGGVRVCEALLPVYHTMGMVVIKPEMYFPKIKETFDDQGNIKPELAESYERAINKAFDELLWYARVLKVARQSTS